MVAATLVLTSPVAATAASSIYLCIGEKAGQGVKSGGTTAPGNCPKVTEKQKVVYVPVAMPKDSAEQEKLLSLLPHIKYTENGVGGKPTIQFSGVNVQVVNGEGKTNTINGEGNLVIGYDESPGAQTGSHSLVMGVAQTFTSFDSVISGQNNTASEPFTDVFGVSNKATGAGASVSGGIGGIASGSSSSVGGGWQNTASAAYSSVSGGYRGSASGETSAVTGGWINTASGEGAAITGGYKNAATFPFSVILGGKEQSTKAEYETIP